MKAKLKYLQKLSAKLSIFENKKTIVIAETEGTVDFWDCKQSDTITTMRSWPNKIENIGPASEV